MAEPLKPVFQRVNQINTFGTDNKLIKSYTITFMVGDQGPFTDTLTADQFNPETVQKIMQETADKINALQQG